MIFPPVIPITHTQKIPFPDDEKHGPYLVDRGDHNLLPAHRVELVEHERDFEASSTA